MIKVYKGIFIHLTTVLLFVFCYLNRTLEIAAISYFSVFLHEIAHLVSAILIGLKPSRIVLFPFGTNLKLKNTLIFSLSDEIILYMSGPLLNAFLCIILVLFFSENKYFSILYYNNLYLFLFNLLPILPMDGGIVAKKILAYRVGSRYAEIILKTVSVIIILVLLSVQGYILVKRSYNFSILFAVIFLTGNLFTNKEKYHTDLTKELMFYSLKNRKKINKVKSYKIKEDTNLKDLIKNFALGNSYLVFKEDKYGKIEKILTEEQIIEEILK